MLLPAGCAIRGKEPSLLVNFVAPERPNVIINAPVVDCVYRLEPRVIIQLEMITLREFFDSPNASYSSRVEIPVSDLIRQALKSSIG